MPRKTVLFIAVLLGLGTLSGAGTYYEERRWEHLEIQVDENSILAFTGTGPSASIELETEEMVREKEEKGYVGAVLTNTRFLAISSVSGRWISEALDPGEEDSAHITVGERTAILVTGTRIVGFTYRNDGFTEYELPLTTRVITEDSGEDFGIVVMSDRAFGLSSETGNFREIRFDLMESFRSLDMAATFALINTDYNIYTYHGSDGSWSTRSKSEIHR